MSLSEQQRWILKHLGIPVWQLRQPVANSHEQPLSEVASSSIPRAVEKAEAYQCQATLLMCYQPFNSPAEQQLLTNINKAITALDITCEQRESNTLQALTVDQPMLQHILIFGESPAALTENWQQHCHILPSLSTLINEPQRKVDVWAAICQLPKILR